MPHRMGTVLWPLAATLLPRVLASPSPPCTTDSETMTLSAAPDITLFLATFPLQQLTCPVLAACMPFPTSESKFCRNPSCAWGEWGDLAAQNMSNPYPPSAHDEWMRYSCDPTQDPGGAPWTSCTDFRLVEEQCPSLFTEKIENYEHWALDSQNASVPEWFNKDYKAARGTLSSGSNQETVFIAAIEVYPNGTAMAWAFSGSLAYAYPASATLTLQTSADPIGQPPPAASAAPASSPAAPPFWIDHPFPPSAPYPPTVPDYPSDYTAGATITVTVDFSGSCADIGASLATKLAPQFGVPASKVNVVCVSKEARRRRRRFDSSSTLTVTVETTSDNEAAVTTAVRDGFADASTASLTLGLGVTSTPDVTTGGGVDKDPHLKFPHGGKADFRGRDGVLYNFFSSPSLSINIKTEESRALRACLISQQLCTNPCFTRTQDATFKLRNSKLIVDGSFITEVHFVARTAGLASRKAWANVSFWAEELNEFNTGWQLINGTCSGHQFQLGLGGHKGCGDLDIQVKYSSATFNFREEWAIVVRGNHNYDRMSGPTHRLDVTFKEAAGAAARTLPHGIIGQSFSSAAPRQGKQDNYPESGRIKTSAQAEGAVEGTANMYEMKSPFATDFAFSRFGAAELALPASGLSSKGAEATSTERE